MSARPAAVEAWQLDLIQFQLAALEERVRLVECRTAAPPHSTGESTTDAGWSNAGSKAHVASGPSEDGREAASTTSSTNRDLKAVDDGPDFPDWGKVQAVDVCNGELAAEESTSTSSDSERPGALAVKPEGSGSPVAPAAMEATVQHVEDLISKDCYTLKPSVWHSAVLFGSHDVTGPLGTLMLVFAFLLNLLALATFLGVLIMTDDNFLNNINPTDEDMRAFRYSIAHLVQRASSVTETSLAARICEQDRSLTEGSTQVEMIEMSAAYTRSIFGGSEDKGGFSVGVGLSMLCIVVWYLNIAPELCDAYYWMRAMALVPRGADTIISTTEAGQLELKQLSAPRFAMVLHVGIVRLATTLTILICGAQWLAQTTNMENLVLNASALTCLKIDQLLFAVLAPRPVQKAIESMAPLRMPKPWMRKGVELRSIAVFLGGIALLTGALVLFILPAQENMINAHHAMCGGDVNFVVANDASGAYLWSPTSPFGEPPASTRGESVVAGLVNGMESTAACEGHKSPVSGAKMFCPEDAGSTGFQRLRTHATLGLPELQVAHGTFCEEDMGGDLPAHWLHLLEAQLGMTEPFNFSNSSADYCRDFSEHCGDVDKPLLRTMCPVTCGCRDPHSGLVSRSGCPPTCSIQSRFLWVKSKSECRDSSVEELRSTRNWDTIVDGFNTPHEQWLGARLREHGCAVVQEWPEVFCTDGSEKMSLALLCPQACRCDETMTAACPPSCAPYIGCEDNLTYTDPEHHLRCFEWQDSPCEPSRLWGGDDYTSELRAQCPFACRQCGSPAPSAALPSGCEDSDAYEDPEFGARCFEWEGHDCRPSSRWLKEGGANYTDELLFRCPAACFRCPAAECEDDAAFVDPEFGLRCPAWRGFDCQPSPRWSGANYSEELKSHCPFSCRQRCGGSGP